MEKYFFFCVPTHMVSSGCGLDELLRVLLCEFNIELSIVFPFPTPSGAFESRNVEKYFFFRFPILMASDGGGLKNRNRSFLYELNIKLSILFPFLTPSEVLRVGTYLEKYFFSAFHFSWPRNSDGGGSH